jgi:hypothetical protein
LDGDVPDYFLYLFAGVKEVADADEVLIVLIEFIEC